MDAVTFFQQQYDRLSDEEKEDLELAATEEAERAYDEVNESPYEVEQSSDDEA